jgi:hypothetical protein
MTLDRGIWNIPIPDKREVVQPTALIVPLIGFDEAGYRLGYGGGYYDRTLAVMNPRPFTVGVGFELGRLRTIHPQPHDIPLDVIITEAGVSRFRDRGAKLAANAEEAATYASPPCYLREVDPAYLGYLGTAETIALLNKLLEGERAGARGLTEMAKDSDRLATTATLSGIARDEARFCAMLADHIQALGGTPSTVTGSFYLTLTAEENREAKIGLLNRGQAWVVRKLREALPRLPEGRLHDDLKHMLEVHERNIRRCEELPRRNA